MSQWTSEYAILRDLSVAQGRVPVAIEGTVGAGDKPPSLNITEETEEEFFKQCSADADVSAAPDLGLIKKMLDMVRDINVSSDEDYGSDKVVVITKLNPLSSEFVPKINNTSTPLDQSPKKETKTKKPKKRQRNIAVESILQAMADKVETKDVEPMSEPVKLLKPNDFITNNNVKENEMIGLIKPVQIDVCQESILDKNVQLTEATKHVKINETSAPTAVEKVNGWFKTQTENLFPKKAPKVMLEATNMFKRKTVTEKAKIVESTVKSPTSSNSGEYIPSVLANEYYQKYVERSKFKESVKDDIWTKAERKMKEIDAKRKRELARTLTSPSSTSQGSDEVQSFEDTQSTDFLNKMKTASVRLNHCLDLVSLPQHRHMIPGECIVCEVIHNFKLKDLSVEKTELDNITSDEKTDEISVTDDIDVDVDRNLSSLQNED